MCITDLDKLNLVGGLFLGFQPVFLPKTNVAHVKSDPKIILLIVLRFKFPTFNQTEISNSRYTLLQLIKKNSNLFSNLNGSVIGCCLLEDFFPCHFQPAGGLSSKQKISTFLLQQRKYGKKIDVARDGRLRFGRVKGRPLVNLIKYFA